MGVRRMIPIEDAADALGMSVESLRSRALFTLRLHVPARDGRPPILREYVLASLLAALVRMRVD